MNDTATNASPDDARPRARRGNTIAPLPGEAGIPNVAAAPALTDVAQGPARGRPAGRCRWSRCRRSRSSASRRAARSPTTGNPSASVTARPPRRPSRASSRCRCAARQHRQRAGAEPPRIPALIPTADEEAEPIGVRRTGTGAPLPRRQSGRAGGRARHAGDRARPQRPARTAAHSTGTASRRQHTDERASHAGSNDALAATTRNLEDYQHQLQGLLETLTRSTTLATRAPSSSRQATSARARLGSTMAARWQPRRGRALRRPACSAASCRDRRRRASPRPCSATAA